METAEQTKPQPVEAKPQQAATPVQPEQVSLTPAMPRNPESFATATLKGTVEAAATFAIAAATPMQQGEVPPVVPVKIFDKEPDNRSALEAFRQKTAEQMAKREQKAASSGRVSAEKPIGASERKAEQARQQKLKQVRSQLARTQARAP